MNKQDSAQILLLNDLSSINQVQCKALHQMRQKQLLTQQQFVQQMRIERDSHEQALTSLQKTYSVALVNILNMKNKIGKETSCQAPTMLVSEHLLKMEELKTQHRQDLRRYIDQSNDNSMKLQKEIGALEDELQSLYVVKAARDGEITILKNSVEKQTDLIIRQQKLMKRYNKTEADLEPSLLPDESAKPRMKGFNFLNQQEIINQMEAEISKKNDGVQTLELEETACPISEINTSHLFDQTRTATIKLDTNGVQMMGLPAETVHSSVIPWLLAQDNSFSQLSQNHSILLKNFELVENEIGVLRLRLTDKELEYQKWKQQLEIEKNLNKQLDIQNKQQQVQLANIKERAKLSQEEYEKIIDELKQKDIKTEAKVLSCEVEIQRYKAQEESLRMNILTDLKQQLALEENFEIGELQRQIVYLNNFEHFYQKALTQLTERIKSLEASNEELRVANLKFNGRIQQIQVEAIYDAEQRLGEEMISLVKGKDLVLTENSQLERVIIAKDITINNLTSQFNQQRDNAERLEQIRQVFSSMIQDQSTQISRQDQEIRYLSRKFNEFLDEKFSTNSQYNSLMQMVNTVREQGISLGVRKDQIINCLKLYLLDLLMGKSMLKKQQNKHEALQTLKELLISAPDIPLDDTIICEMERVEPSESKGQWLLNQSAYANSLTQNNVSKQAVKENDIEAQIRTRKYEVPNLVAAFVQTDKELVMDMSHLIKEVVLVVEKSEKSLQCSFPSENSAILRDAYTEIRSLKQQVANMSKMYGQLDSMKQTLFEEIYWEDLHLLKQQETMLIMGSEDVYAHQLRFNKLNIWKHTHHCPTWEDFVPRVTEMIETLRSEKDAVIQQRDQEISVLQDKIASVSDCLSKQNLRYYSLADLLRKIEAPQLEPIISPDVKEKIAKINQSLMKIESKTYQDTLAFKNVYKRYVFITRSDNSTQTIVVERPPSVLAAFQAKQKLLQQGESAAVVSTKVERKKKEKPEKEHHISRCTSIVKASNEEAVGTVVMPQEASKPKRHSRHTSKAPSSANLTNQTSIPQQIEHNPEKSRTIIDFTKVTMPPQRVNSYVSNVINTQNGKPFVYIDPPEVKQLLQDVAIGSNEVSAQGNEQISSREAITEIMEERKFDLNQILPPEQQTDQPQYEQHHGQVEVLLNENNKRENSEYYYSSDEEGEESDVSLYEVAVQSAGDDSHLMENYLMAREDVFSNQFRQLKFKQLLRFIQKENNTQLESQNNIIQELRIQFQNRPSREEDIAQIRHLSQQVETYKDWYYQLMRENALLIKQLSITEKNAQSFFNTRGMTVDPETKSNSVPRKLENPRSQSHRQIRKQPGLIQPLPASQQQQRVNTSVVQQVQQTPQNLDKSQKPPPAPERQQKVEQFSKPVQQLQQEQQQLVQSSQIIQQQKLESSIPPSILQAQQQVVQQEQQFQQQQQIQNTTSMSTSPNSIYVKEDEQARNPVIPPRYGTIRDPNELSPTGAAKQLQTFAMRRNLNFQELQTKSQKLQQQLEIDKQNDFVKEMTVDVPTGQPGRTFQRKIVVVNGPKPQPNDLALLLTNQEKIRDEIHKTKSQPLSRVQTEPEELQIDESREAQQGVFQIDPKQIFGIQTTDLIQGNNEQEDQLQVPSTQLSD